MSVDCNNCEYWKKGLEELNRFIITEQARNPRNPYEAKPFVYCPWCGAELSETEEKAA